MRILYPIIAVFLVSFWAMCMTQSSEISSCKYATSIGLSENSLELKISSCEILHKIILDQIKSNGNQYEIKGYVKQWVKNCTKTIEFDVTQPLLNRR